MIVINFNNPNSRTLTTIELYRSPLDVPIPDEPTEQPIAKLDGFATQYVDKDVVLGQNYNYRFRVSKPGGSSVMSPTYVFGDVSLYGPGEYLVAESGTATIWSYGIVVDEENLPGVDDFKTIVGDSATFHNWTGQWLKFRVGADIFYTPYRACIEIPTDDFESFMSRASTNRTLVKGLTEYTHIKTMSGVNASAVLDGRYPTLRFITKEVNRVNPVMYYAPFGGTAPVNSKVLYAVTDESNGLLFSTTGVGYAACTTQYLYMNTHYNYSWYWKPIIQLIPSVEKNP